jgi:hypothetical protein
VTAYYFWPSKYYFLRSLADLRCCLAEQIEFACYRPAIFPSKPLLGAINTRGVCGGQGLLSHYSRKLPYYSKNYAGVIHPTLPLRVWAVGMTLPCRSFQWYNIYTFYCFAGCRVCYYCCTRFEKKSPRWRRLTWMENQKPMTLTVPCCHSHQELAINQCSLYTDICF